jgi:hypothetical protein
MPHPRLTPLALTALIATAGPAFATAGLSCSISDKSFQLEMSGVVSHGVGAALISAEGAGKSSIAILSDGMKTFTFDRDQITQYWLNGNVLKLRIYRESEGSTHETLDLEIEARQRGGIDSPTFPGTYTATATSMAGVTGSEAKSATVKGKISCSVE